MPEKSNQRLDWINKFIDKNIIFTLYVVDIGKKMTRNAKQNHHWLKLKVNIIIKYYNWIKKLET